MLVAHDEMTAQANDGKTMSWVWQGEQPLKKRVLDMGCTNLMLYAPHWDGLKMPVKPLNMAKIMMGIKMGNSLSNRSVSDSY